MATFWQDLRYAVRLLAKSPGFAAVAVLTLALGIGANTAIFTVADALLLKPLPYSAPGQLALVYATRTADRTAVGPFSYPRFELLRQRERSFSSFAVFTNDNFNLTGRGEPQQISAARVSWSFFNLLGVRPVLGRAFLPDEDQPSGNRVAIISHAFWMREFGGARNAIGQSLALDSQSYTIIGVLPGDFSFQPLGNDVPIWIPREFELNIATPAHIQRGVGYLNGVGRLAPGVSLEQAQAEMDVLDKEYRHDNPEKPDADPKRPIAVASLQSQVVSNIRPAVLILMGAVGVVLLIACANVASLLLSRALKRKKEIAVRAALGASRGVIIRQLLIESLLIAAVGGVAGIFAGYGGTQALLALNQTSVPELSTGVHMDWRVLSFTLLISLASGLFFGLAPALQISKTDLTSVLRDEGRGSTGSHRGGMLQNSLVVVQVALSMILLIGSGLLIRSFLALMTQDPGFDPSHVVTMQIDLPPSKYSTSAQMISFYNNILRQVESLPGVTAATISSALPVNASRLSPMLAEGQPVVPFPQRPIVNIETISPDYAKVMRVPLIRGREFTAQDNENAPTVAIVNQAFVRRYWPNQNPIGKHIWIGLITAAVEVVGVFGDVKNMSLTAEANPEILFPFPNLPWADLRLSVRSAGDPQSLVPAIRDRLAAIDSSQPISNVRTLDQLLNAARAQSRFTMTLFGIFSGMALVLAIVGIYGVISYASAQRSQEMGIRMALGADKKDIFRLVIGRGLRLAGIGILIGLVAPFTLTRLMSSLLYKVSPADPLTIIGSAILFLAAAFLASYVPARRASRTDPMVALRYE
ncbi:MAG: ABC transporter permease [Candidatus Acidiferrales bacterium]